MPSGRRHRDTGFAQSAAQRIGKAGPLFRAEKAADDPAAATGNKRKLAPEELETEDVLEMVNAGLVKITVAD